jgi:predicted acyltransferase
VKSKILDYECSILIIPIYFNNYLFYLIRRIKNRRGIMAENKPVAELKARKKRVESIDAFRGFTIFSMIFVIMVAGYKNLPLTFSHFNSAPVSTFKHAAEDGASEEWEHWETKNPGKSTFQKSAIVSRINNNTYDVSVSGNDYAAVRVVHAKPLNPGDSIIAIKRPGGKSPEFRGIGNGCTFTDLVAPFFVFIVGLCIPLSRRRRGKEWWKHVGSRTVMLIIAGVIYISLILKFSWWWGILQAIGIAYFMGAAFMLLPKWQRWIGIVFVAAVHGFMSWHFKWWLDLGVKGQPFFTILNPGGDMLRPLIVHCTPWASISYGICTIIGTLLGEAIVTRDPKTIIKQSLLLGCVFTVAGYLIHRFWVPMNKDYVSVSYSFFTSGIGALSFLVFYLIIDLWEMKKWAIPFNIFGANALLAYFMQPIVRILLVALGFYEFFKSHSGWYGVWAGFLWTMLLWCVILWCNRKKLYWKL